MTILEPTIALDQPRAQESHHPWLIAFGVIQVLATILALQLGSPWVWAPVAVLIAFVAFLFPRAGVFILATAIYLRWDLPGFAGVYPADVVAFLIIGGALARRLASGRPLLVATPVDFPLIAILAVFGLSLVNAFDPVKGTINWLRHLQLFGLLVAIVGVVEKEDIPRLGRWLLILALLFSVRNIVVFAAAGGTLRIFGPPGAFFPFFLTLMILHAVAGAILSGRRRARWGWTALALVYLLAQIATQTREAWLQLFLTLLVMAGILLKWARREGQVVIRRRVRTFLAVGAVVILVFLSGTVSIFETSAARAVTAVEGRSTTIATRLFLWRTGLHAFVTSPALGIGLGQVQRWDEFLPFWRFDPIAEHSRGLGAHNDLITYISETGLLGLAAVFWLFWRLNGVARGAWRHVHRADDAFAVLAVWMPVCAFILRFFFGTHTFYSMSGIVTALYSAMLIRYCLPISEVAKRETTHRTS